LKGSPEEIANATFSFIISLFSPQMTSFSDHSYSDLRVEREEKIWQKKKKRCDGDGQWTWFSGGQSRRRNGPTLKILSKLRACHAARVAQNDQT
jgi:hypothetical protein